MSEKRVISPERGTIQRQSIVGEMKMMIRDLVIEINGKQAQVQGPIFVFENEGAVLCWRRTCEIGKYEALLCEAAGIEGYARLIFLLRELKGGVAV